MAARLGQVRPREVRKRCSLVIEHLESRDLLAVGGGLIHTLKPTFIVLHPANEPFSGPGPVGYTPTQIKHAYGFDQLSFNNGNVAADGTGMTIAIVDAFDDPTIRNDLHQFDLAFGLPDPTLTIQNETGGSTLPPPDTSTPTDDDWEVEESLDVEWTHAIAPKANILFIEANSPSDADLFAGASYAATQPGVAVVSMSFGGSEFAGETGFDNDFTTPNEHTGVTFVASSGDNGAPPSYPSISPNVLSVGGTDLFLDSNGNLLPAGETGWSGSGGGISTQETQPGYQHGVVTQSSTMRTNPDVSYDADPNTGFPVYDTYSFGTTDPWAEIGGTSDAAPQWAALIAIADQGRVLAGKTPLDGATQTLPMIYSMASSNFRDITTGTSTGTPHETAAAGYDLVTGRGSPIVTQLVPSLIGASSPTVVAQFVISAPSATTAGSPFSITVTAANSLGNPVAGYTGTISFSSSDLNAVLPANYPFTATDAGVHTFNITLETAGSQTISVVDTSDSSDTGKASVTVAPASPNKLVFSQEPSNVVEGVDINPAVVVEIEDTYNNLVTTDSSDQVMVSFNTNPGGGTLSGTTMAKVSGGVATFGTLSINQPDSGYTLSATATGLASAISSSFQVTTIPPPALIEGFESNDANMWNVVGGPTITGSFLSTAAAHDGSFGFDDTNGNDWMYRTDAAAQAKPGDQLSVWLQFPSAANGRAYFGFCTSASGDIALVAAPNTGQLIIQSVAGFSNYLNLASVSQSYLAGHWYRLEVDLGTNGTVIGKIFDSNGTTLLGQVVATNVGNTAGGIALRATGSDKYWDTITDTPGVNGPLFPKVQTPPLSPPSAPPTAGEASPQAQSASAPAGSGLWSLGIIDSLFTKTPPAIVFEYDVLSLLGLPPSQPDEWTLPF